MFLPCSPVPLSHILHKVFVVAPMQCLAGVLSRVSFNLIRGSFTELTMDANQVASDYILRSILVQVSLQFYIQVWLEFLTGSFGTVCRCQFKRTSVLRPLFVSPDLIRESKLQLKFDLIHESKLQLKFVMSLLVMHNAHNTLPLSTRSSTNTQFHHKNRQF